MLSIKETRQYTGTISIDGVVIESLSQSFDEKGRMINGTGRYVNDYNAYQENITQCRKEEDEFKDKMREIEDELSKVGEENETKE